MRYPLFRSLFRSPAQWRAEATQEEPGEVGPDPQVAADRRENGVGV